jgi:hypothetical protein
MNINLFRRICIVLVLLGAAALFLRHDSELPTLPVPPAGIHVKGNATIGADGTYYVCVTMPKIDQSLTLDSEVLPCALEVSIAQHEQILFTKEITSLILSSEFGFARLKYYKGGDSFHLDRGEYMIDVFSRKTCATAASRGATFSFERDVGNPTDYYLRRMLGSWLAIFAFCGGMLGIVGCELMSSKRGIPKA